MDQLQSLPIPTASPGAQRQASGWLSDARFREVFRWSLPALILGALLRIAVTFSMPYGYTQYDSEEYLSTPRIMVTEHRLHINKKRSFLTPVIFTLPFYLPVPALLTIPATQHLMGLVAALVAGAIVRLWFKHWKWFILPATLLIAANPMMIWYEHSLLGEAQYAFFALVAALAGTLWFIKPSPGRFALLMLSLVLVSGTRLEGKLFFLASFGLIAVTFWKSWAKMALHGAIAFLLMAGCFLASGSRDGSGLLLASLIQLAPDHFKSAPQLEPYLLPIRDDLRKRFPDYPGDLVKASIRIDRAVDEYIAVLPSSLIPKEGSEAYRFSLEKAICLEILLLHPREVLTLPFIKFRLAIDAWSAYCWDEHYLHERQWQALTLQKWMAPVLSKGLTGKQQSPEELRDWVNAHYDAHRIEWFTKFQGYWNDAAIFLRTPDHRLVKRHRWLHDFFGGVEGDQNVLPGIPFFYFLALAGIITSALCWRTMGAFHFFWAGCMLGVLYLSHMVGVTNARFRFAYAPFFLLYLMLFLETSLDWAIRCRGGCANRPSKS